MDLNNQIECLRAAEALNLEWQKYLNRDIIYCEISEFSFDFILGYFTITLKIKVDQKYEDLVPYFIRFEYRYRFSKGQSLYFIDVLKSPKHFKVYEDTLKIRSLVIVNFMNNKGVNEK